MRPRRHLPGAVIAMGLVLAAPLHGSAQKVYDVAELSAKPSIASPMAAQQSIQKSYPADLQRAGIQGKVVVQFVVKADGKVDPSSITVQSSEEPRLEDPAKKAIADIQFVPGEVDGSAVATRVIFPISYVAR